jgi:hypothetical protein
MSRKAFIGDTLKYRNECLPHSLKAAIQEPVCPELRGIAGSRGQETGK